MGLDRDSFSFMLWLLSAMARQGALLDHTLRTDADQLPAA